MESFSDLLRHWRSLRRLSQLDLALEAGVSARHISFLETGRARPSRDMVLHLGAILRVPLDRRNQMLGAVGFAPKFSARAWDDAEMAPIRRAVDWTLERHAPYPGIAIDKLWTIRRMNGPARAIFGAMGAVEGASMIDIVQRREVQSAIENWPEVARHLALRLRAESAAQGGIPKLDDAERHLSGAAGPSGEGAPAVPTIFKLGGQRLALVGTIAQFSSTGDSVVE
ncbi:MAG: helix-turn-helix domain-containing protein, partial [Pseudomonadota bacterium]